MQIVIDIPNKEYERLVYMDMFKLRGYIENGILLPKGHGRLGDLDALEQEMINGIKAGNYESGYDDYSHINNTDDCVECVRYADTIIEADKAESEE